jgi:hypothetical protein
MLCGTQFKQQLFSEHHKVSVICDENAARFCTTEFFKYIIRKWFEI